MEGFFDSILANLVTEFIIVLFGVLVANQIQRYLKQLRYGRWKMRLLPVKPIVDGESGLSLGELETSRAPVLERDLSADTAQRILNDKTEFDIFVKGRISPFYDVKCDLVTELDSGHSDVITRDDVNRVITVYAHPDKLAPKSQNHTR